MKKEFTISKYIKKMFIFIGVILVGLTLASCDSSNRTSTQGINLDEVYATSGNYKVTNGDLYEEFCFNGSSYIEEAFNNALYAEEIEAIKADLAKDDSEYKKDMDDIILEAIYGTSDEDELASEEEDHLNEHRVQFVDTMYQKGYTITKEQIIIREFSSVYANYYVELAKKVAAKKVLAKDLGSETENVDYDKLIANLKADDAKISEDDVITYYKNNYVNKGAVDAVLVRFNNSTEAANVLKKFGLKAYDGHFYLVQLPSDKTNEVYTSSTKFEEYVSNQTITSENTNIELQGAGYATSLRIYAEIYNYVYTFRDQIVFDENTTFAKFVENFKTTEGEEAYNNQKHLMYYYFVQSIIEADAEYRTANTDSETAEFNKEAEEAKFASVAEVIKQYNETAPNKNYTVLDNDRLNGYNSSLATYVYETLVVDSEDESLNKRYITSARSYGSYYYLVFKIAQEADQELYTESKDENDKTVYSFEGHEELLKEILKELVNDKLTDDYVSEKYTERAKEAKYYIYDSILELEFMQTSSTIAANYKKVSKKDKENVAMIKYNDKETKVSAKDFFDFMEKTTGASTALTLLFNQYVKSTDEYKKLEDKYDNYKDSLELMLNYFSNGYYESYGYNASLGKFNFLRLLYHSANIDEVIRDNMMLSDAKSALLSNVNNVFAEGTFLTKVEELATADFNDYFNVSATEINIYTDIDEDDEADELSQELEEKAFELLDLVVEHMNKSTESYTSALSSIISEYNSTSRYMEDALPTSTETVWAPYRKLGLYISQTTLSSVTKGSNYDEMVLELLENAYNDESLNDPINGLKTTGFIKESFLLDNQASLLLVTSTTSKTSAKYEDEEKIEKLYKNIPTLFNDKLVLIEGIDYSGDLASEKAMQAYLYDYFLLGDVNSLPATTNAHLDAYFLPYLQRYTSSTNRVVLMNEMLPNITFANEKGAEQLANYIRIIKAQYDSYEETYASWWTFMSTAKEVK